MSIERLELTGLPFATQFEWLVSLKGAGTRAAAKFRTLASETPVDGGVARLVVASCYYDDVLFGPQARAYGETLKSMAQPVDLKLLVGDNLYLDVARDQRSIWGGWEETAHRYRHYFWESEAYADALSQQANLTTWDDHEFWNNYPERQFWLERTSDEWRPEYDEAGQAFLETFQNSLNLLPGSSSIRTHEYVTPACSIFLADTRTQRSSINRLRPWMMAQTEFQALLTWLGSLTEPGVLVLGQPLWHSRGSRFDYAPIDFEDQFGRLWAALKECKADVLVVSGDVHHSRVLQIDCGDGVMLHEFVSSPAVHIPSGWSIFRQKYNSQGKGSIGYPKTLTIPRSGSNLPWFKPTVSKCFASTNLPNTIGELVLRRIPQGDDAALIVEAAFWDTLKRRRLQPCSFMLRTR
ncbi:MAG: alkaline phosphatase D family protein [Planctomycetes bacterium]|nr:alkaline phosphatase D family protein [Planctomycetota bacterium]MCW8134411.1 alkaline phosphatase D family protein [Planctomycetota bacterium]